MEISTILIGLVVFTVIFLLFREINCWYWKINERIEIAQKQTLLLERIAENLAGGSNLQKQPPKIYSPDQPDTNNSTKSDNSVISGKSFISDNSVISEPEAYSTLSENEKVTANKYLNYGLSKGEKLVINKSNRNIERFDKSEWNKILKEFKQNEWAIISEKL